MKTKLCHLSLVIVACMGLAITLYAQVQTKTTTTAGTPTKEVKVDRAEVVDVTGNDLIVKMEDGQIRHIPNVPETARVTVDGKQLGIHELKPGMKLERTITTTTTPRTITKVETVTGKVWHVSPPKYVTLTLENGENQQFTIPEGQKFTVNGEETDAFGLKKGMVVSATRVTETHENVIEHEQQVSGTMPPPPPAPPANVPILIAMVAPTPAPPAQAQAPAAELPKTSTLLPLVGLLGLLVTGSSLYMKWTQR